VRDRALQDSSNRAEIERARGQRWHHRYMATEEQIREAPNSPMTRIDELERENRELRALAGRL